MAASAPQIIYGCMTVSRISTEELNDTLLALKKYNVNSLDTAHVYSGSEATLGEHDAPKRFKIHTKAPALGPGCQSRQSVLEGMERSLKDLGVDAFGISNYLPHDVQQIYDIQSAANSVLPTVYQGNYNAVARHNEADLIPLLRKLHMNFYAYSPIAGGFLAKDTAQLQANIREGRFTGKSFVGDMYQSLYGKDSMYEALDVWNEIARDAGIKKAALAYRWIVHHSALGKGDGIVVGARDVGQLEETLMAIANGPLEERVAERAGGIWEMVRRDAPRDNWNDYLSLKV
ncbi:MAG: hypothetical protein Q9181_003540 [Wetmoreana brouardii]